MCYTEYRYFELLMKSVKNMYTKNIGTCDRMTRIILSVVLAVFGYYKLSGVMQIIAFALAGMMLVTSMMRFCGLYTLLGVNTTKCGCGVCGTCKCDGKGRCEGSCKTKKTAK